jgi:hypothetical protein
MAAWDVVCSPKHLGGLEVKNLRLMNLALRMRWLWLEKEEVGKPWRGLDFTLLPEAEELFKAATTCVLGDGKLLKFCTDRWLDNTSISESAPSLWSFVEPARKNDTVADALEDHAWTSSFRLCSVVRVGFPAGTCSPRGLSEICTSFYSLEGAPRPPSEASLGSGILPPVESGCFDPRGNGRGGEGLGRGEIHVGCNRTSGFKWAGAKYRPD